MNLPLDVLLTYAAVVLIGGSVLGGLLMALLEARGGSRIRARLSEDAAVGVQGGPAPAAEPSALVAALFGGLRRIGDRVAVSDPAQVSALRSKLMQAGYMNREAVPLYLGGRIAA